MPRSSPPRNPAGQRGLFASRRWRRPWQRASSVFRPAPARSAAGLAALRTQRAAVEQAEGRPARSRNSRHRTRHSGRRPAGAPTGGGLPVQKPQDECALQRWNCPKAARACSATANQLWMWIADVGQLVEQFCEVIGRRTGWLTRGRHRETAFRAWLRSANREIRMICG